jgi:pimeloyl-ACP methyl ester carboxylesterase
MADSQVPWGVQALGGEISEPAWNSKPSWYLLTTEDRMIPPPAQRFMSKRAGSTVVEVAASHAVYVSQPNAVATLIKQAGREPTRFSNWAQENFRKQLNTTDGAIH